MIAGLDFLDGEFGLGRNSDFGPNLSLGLPPAALTQSGFLRTVRDVAIDPLSANRYWITDDGTSSSTRKIVEVRFNGVSWVQTVLVTFAEADSVRGLVVSPVTFAPESDATTLAIAALLDVLTARSRARV